MIKKNIFSILVALIIMYLSLANSHTFNKVTFFSIPNFDKIVHFGMYFGLMLVIIFENRKTFKNVRSLLLTGLIPLFYGILLEILQSTLTMTRTGSFFDVLFNGLGILVAILVWLWVRSSKKERSDSY